MQFVTEGFCVVDDLLSPSEVDVARMLSAELVARHKTGEALVVGHSVSVAAVTLQHPQRNPGVQPSHCDTEPFIIGDLVALDPRFGVIFAKSMLWDCAAGLLNCSQNEVVFHLSNLTRKPRTIGPAIGWHRDADNTYCSAADGRTVRILFPLQPMDVANGGTAVRPGSHLSTSHGAADDPFEPVYPSVPPGSALALHARVLHGGDPNRSHVDREVLVVQFGVASSPLLCRSDEWLSLYSLKEVEEFSVTWTRAHPPFQQTTFGDR